jgi:hypothetical protein
MIRLRNRSRTIQSATLSLLLTFSLVLTSCIGLFPAPILTPTPFVSETATPSILWFPPTNTPTFFPTRAAQPTLDLRPGLGELIFQDNFDQPGPWNPAASSSASASVAINRLILSITGQGPLFLTRLRTEPVVGNFYAEAVAHINLCSGKSEYGMLFRGGPQDYYYRFAISCDGQVRAERVRSLQVDTLQNWLISGDASSSAPAEVKIGIWAMGNEMRFFLNNHYQFTARDPVFTSGLLGFFVYASGSTPVTVSFSNLAVYAISYVSPTPSLTPSITPIPSRTPNP